MYTQETTCEIPEIPIVNGKTLRRILCGFCCLPVLNKPLEGVSSLLSAGFGMCGIDRFGL